MIEENGRIHNQVADLLSAYIDGEVTADERALVETHLATCTACAQDLATLRQTVILVRQLPQLAAPRPFTLRESDVRPMRMARPAWWRLPWAQGLAAAAAVLLVVVVAGGVLLLGRTGMVATPAAPESVALQARAPTEATAEKTVVEKTVEVEAEKVVVETTVVQAVEAPAAEEAAPEAPMALEAPAEAPSTESIAAADEAEMDQATAYARSEAGAAAVPTPTLAPTPRAMLVTPAPALLEVEDLALRIEPGIIRVSGQLPLPEGRKLLAELWRDDHPIEWAMPESQQAIVEANGQFQLELQARPDLSDFNLFRIEPANYEIRIRPVDPPEPVEARIPFDTFGPLPPEPTRSP